VHVLTHIAPVNQLCELAASLAQPWQSTSLKSCFLGSACFSVPIRQQQLYRGGRLKGTRPQQENAIRESRQIRYSSAPACSLDPSEGLKASLLIAVLIFLQDIERKAVPKLAAVLLRSAQSNAGQMWLQQQASAKDGSTNADIILRGLSRCGTT
jgi:hypothetical protein